MKRLCISGIRKLGWIALVLVIGQLAAQVPQTPNLGLWTPPQGYPNWGALTNQNFNTLDTVVGTLQHQYQGAWSGASIYALGQIVSYNSATYIALAGGNVNHQPDTSPSYWVAIAGVTWRGTWSPGTYAANDMVSYLGSTYISTAAGNTATPPSSPWSVMAQAGATGPGGTGTSQLNPRIAPISTTNSSGNAAAQRVIVLAGNSLVQVDNGIIGQYCGNTSFQPHPAQNTGIHCIKMTAVSIDSGGLVTATLATATDIFHVGDRITPTAGTAGLACLYDSVNVTAVNSPTSITFATAGTGTQCSAQTTSGLSYYLTPDIVKFGINGATLDAWRVSGTQSGMPAMLTYLQTLITAGKTPILVMDDAGISTNSIRQGAFSYAGFVGLGTSHTSLAAVMDSIEATSATNSEGKTVTMTSFPIVMNTGNTYGCVVTQIGVLTVPITTAGSGQTPGTYIVNATGGGGSGAVAQIVVAAGGTVTATPTIISPGTGYTSAPTFTLAAGGTPATFTPTIGADQRNPCGTYGANAGALITGQIQYVNPAGTTGARYTAPLVTSGAITAGANTVTLNFCDPALWGGPGDPLPSTTDFNGALTRHTTPVAVILDTVGSGVQETVGVTSITDAGSGINGMRACSIGFTAANAHGAGFQVVTTENTADQTYSDWKTKIPLDIAGQYPNVLVWNKHKLFGDNVMPISLGYIIGNELHPVNVGYGMAARGLFDFLAPYMTSNDLGERAKFPLFASIATGEVYKPDPASVPGLTPQTVAASMASPAPQSASSMYNPDTCMDDHYFYPTLMGLGAQAFDTTSFYWLVSALTPSLPTQTQGYAGDFLTGDAFWTEGMHCFFPTTSSNTSTLFSAGVERLNWGGAARPIAPAIANGFMEVRRPKIVHPAAAAYNLAHPFTYPAVMNGTVTSTTATSMTITWDIVQPDKSYNISPSSVSMLAGDSFVFANGTTVQLPAGGAYVGGLTTGVWTETSGVFNYKNYNGLRFNFFAPLRQDSRAYNATFTNTTTVSLNTQSIASAGGVSISGYPSVSVFSVQNAGTGSLTSGNTYFYDIALVPASTTTTPTCNGPLVNTSFTASAGATKVNILLNSNTIPPTGYVYALWGRPATIGGTYGFIKTSATASISDDGTITPGAAPSVGDSCNIGVQGATFLTGASGTTFAVGAAAGTGSPTIAAKTGHVNDTLSGALTVTTGTSPTTGTLFTATFPTAHTNNANCQFQLFLPGTGLINTWEPLESATAAGITMDSALTASTAYTVTYRCGGK
jgi:hypothetical protein